MARCFFFATFLIALTGAMNPAAAEEEARPFRIGVLFWHESKNDLVAFEGLRHGLEVASFEYKIFEEHLAENEDRAREVIEMFRDEIEVDVIVAMGTKMTTIAMELEREIPIVFSAVTNPESAGIVNEGEGTSGRNVTGVSTWVDTRNILREFRRTIPEMKHLGILLSMDNPVSTYELRASQDFLSGEDRWRDEYSPEVDWDALRSSLRITPIRVAEESQIEGATASLISADVDAIWVPIDFQIYENVERVAKVAWESKVPLVSSSMKAISHSVVSVTVNFKRAGLITAAMVSEILTKGANPAEMVVRMLPWYEVTINMDAASAVDLEIPLSALTNAEEIIRSKIP
ncbi:MAG: ABC transporter substrate-binding protein [Planctomycetes bacterium]|nr:ABC transporter substrate-binding protein [Planctomycetota bacterium]